MSELGDGSPLGESNQKRGADKKDNGIFLACNDRRTLMYLWHAIYTLRPELSMTKYGKEMVLHTA
jgi:hypothetical protein